MVDTPPDADSPVTGNVLFYSQPEPLNRETHRAIGLRRIEKPYEFARGSNIVPLTVTEFPAAAITFPIIFAGERRQPLAMMGINPNQNIYINDQGVFDTGVYVPAYIRRYPFVLANDTERNQMVVCLDRAAPMLGPLPEWPLFDAKGEPTDYAKHCIEFCNGYDTEVRRTESFVALLTELDLFETKQAAFNPVNPDGTPAGPPQVVAEYYAVSEEKLKALPDEKLRQLMENGALSQIYAHLTSLMGWDRLMAVTFERNNLAATAANRN
jgi:hypothetical protein